MTTLTPDQQAIADRESKKAASQDLTLARTEGTILICQTKRGTLSLTHEDGTFTLVSCRDGEVIEVGTRAQVRKVLAPLYDVIFAEEK
jgi:hypothetical protein